MIGFPRSDNQNSWVLNRFDILITCTGATTAIIDNTLYQSLLNGEMDKKIIIDLAIPNDIDAEVLANNAVHYIEVSSLQAIANKNML